MSELILQLPEEVLIRLQHEAERQQIAVTDLIQSVIEGYLDDDDEPTNEQILDDLREAMRDALAGNGRPAREILDDIKRDLGYDANQRSRS